MDIIVYHADCRDGWCAAFLAKKKYLNAELVPAFHGSTTKIESLEDAHIANKDVLFVDFTFKRPEMERIANQAKSLTVFDHHKTAKENLDGFDGYLGKTRVVFDMNRSGAGITFDELYTEEKVRVPCHPHQFGNPELRHWMPDYVEDRDIWRWELPESKAVNEYINTLPMTYEAWNEAWQNVDPEEAKRLGRILVTRTEQYNILMAKNARTVSFEGHDVLCINAPPFGISELLAELAKDRPFSIGWSQASDGMFRYSLRSEPKDGSIDVAAIAKKFGGGGHKNAAGFSANTLLF